MKYVFESVHFFIFILADTEKKSMTRRTNMGEIREITQWVYGRVPECQGLRRSPLSVSILNSICLLTFGRTEPLKIWANIAKLQQAPNTPLCPPIRQKIKVLQLLQSPGNS